MNGKGGTCANRGLALLLDLRLAISPFHFPGAFGRMRSLFRLQ